MAIRLPKEKSRIVERCDDKDCVIDVILRIEPLTLKYYVDQNIPAFRRMEIEEDVERAMNVHVGKVIDAFYKQALKFSNQAPFKEVEHKNKPQQATETLKLPHTYRGNHYRLVKELPAFPYTLRFKFEKKEYADKFLARFKITE